MLLEIRDTREEGSRDDLCSGFSLLHIKHCIGFPLKLYKTYLLKHKLQKTNKQTNKREQQKAARLQNILCTIKLIKKSLYTLHTVAVNRAYSYLIIYMMNIQ